MANYNNAKRFASTDDKEYIVSAMIDLYTCAKRNLHRSDLYVVIPNLTTWPLFYAIKMRDTGNLRGSVSSVPESFSHPVPGTYEYEGLDFGPELYGLLQHILLVGTIQRSLHI